MKRFTAYPRGALILCATLAGAPLCIGVVVPSLTYAQGAANMSSQQIDSLTAPIVKVPPKVLPVLGVTLVVCVSVKSTSLKLILPVVDKIGDVASSITPPVALAEVIVGVSLVPVIVIVRFCALPLAKIVNLSPSLGSRFVPFGAPEGPMPASTSAGSTCTSATSAVVGPCRSDHA